jgi:hypothetical protein
VSASPYRRLLRGAPRLARKRSPWPRAILATLLVVTLPFEWSEDFSCKEGPKPPVSGFHILSSDSGAGLDAVHVFLALLVLTVALGFLAHATAKPWRRLAAHTVAGVAGLFTTFMCVLMLTYGRPDQPLVYPAAWIGTFAALAITLEAWWSSGVALRLGVERFRARRALKAALRADAQSRLRFVEPAAEAAPWEELAAREEEAAAAEAEPAARRRLH